MATVITPAGQMLEQVHGDLLDYYRGEGYAISEDGGAVPAFPRVFDGEQYVGEQTEVEQLVVADAETARVAAEQAAADAQQVEQLPEGQFAQDDGQEHVGEATGVPNVAVTALADGTVAEVSNDPVDAANTGGGPKPRR